MTKYQQELLDWLNASPEHYVAETEYVGLYGIHHTFRRVYGFHDSRPVLPKTWEAIRSHIVVSFANHYPGVILRKHWTRRD